MKKELEDKINRTFANFPTADRVWVSDKTGEVYLDYTREVGLKEVRRADSSVAAVPPAINKID